MIDINKLIEDEIQRNTTQLQLTVSQQVEQITRLQALVDNRTVERNAAQRELDCTISQRNAAEQKLDELCTIFAKRWPAYAADQSLLKNISRLVEDRDVIDVQNSGLKRDIQELRQNSDDLLIVISKTRDAIKDWAGYEAGKPVFINAEALARSNKNGQEYVNDLKERITKAEEARVKAVMRAEALQRECDVRNAAPNTDARVEELEAALAEAHGTLKSVKLFLTDEVVVAKNVEDKIENLIRGAIRDTDFSECVTDESTVDSHVSELQDVLEKIESMVDIDENEDDN